MSLSRFQLPSLRGQTLLLQAFRGINIPSMDSARRGRGRQRGGNPSSRRNRRNFHSSNAAANAGASASASLAPGPAATIVNLANMANMANSADSEPLPRVATPPLTEAIPEDTPTFADLAGQNLVHPVLLQTITQDLKFNHMMPVQAATLQELLPPKRSDCLVQAKTGTGKTIAFLLPAIQTMIKKGRGRDGISLLVISPTRELAMQIGKEAQKLLQKLPEYKVCMAIGGTNKDTEERRILARCDILVGTPGRLFDHLSTTAVREEFRHLDTLVLDEADRLLDMGFLNALKDIVKCLPDKATTKRQGMLFSATIAPHVKGVAELVLSPGYQFISTIPEGEVNTHQSVPQHLIKVPSFTLVAPALIGSIQEQSASVGAQAFKAIVFAPTAALANFYGHILSNMPGMPEVAVLHSRISQQARTRTTETYRKAKSGILVATDVVARGMDFPGVTTVFQVGIPADKESYIHRLGRTARAGAEGHGIFIVSEAESFFPTWTLKEISFTASAADVSSAAQVAAIAEQMDSATRAKIYQAWMGYYKNYLKNLKWDKEDLVSQANTYARNALGAVETPGLQKSVVGKMGMRGTKGLVVIPDAPRPHNNRGRVGESSGGGGEGRSVGSGGRGGRGGRGARGGGSNPGGWF